MPMPLKTDTFFYRVLPWQKVDGDFSNKTIFSDCYEVYEQNFQIWGIYEYKTIRVSVPQTYKPVLNAMRVFYMGHPICR